MLTFRTSGGTAHELPYNPAALFGELALQLQYQMDTTDALEFYLRGLPLSMAAQVSDVPIGATDYISVLRPGDAHGHATSPRRSRETRGLPPRDELCDPGQDPPNFSEKVGVLMELGAGTFPVEQCRTALRGAFYNADRAAAYLFASQAQEPPEPPPRSLLTDEDTDIVRGLAEETGRDARLVVQVYGAARRDRDEAYRILIELPDDDD